MPEARRSPEARADLLGIWLHIAHDNPDAADRLLSRLDRTAHRLAQFSALGRLRPELAPELRSMAVENYLVFYRTTPDGIEIVRILHGAQDLPPLFA